MDICVYSETTTAILDEQDLQAPLEISEPTPGYWIEEVLKCIQSRTEKLLLEQKMDEDVFFPGVQSYLWNFYLSPWYKSHAPNLKNSKLNEPKLSETDLKCDANELSSNDLIGDLEILHATPGYNENRYIAEEQGEQYEENNNAAYLSSDDEWFLQLESKHTFEKNSKEGE